MDEDKKKLVMVVVVVACLALAGAIAIKNFSGGGSSISTATQKPQVMLCVNPDCGHIFELTREEMQIQMRDKGPMMMGRGGATAFTCPQCGKESAYQAIRCPKCNTVFTADYGSDDFTDRCPECGYSAIEEKRQQKDE